MSLKDTRHTSQASVPNLCACYYSLSLSRTNYITCYDTSSLVTPDTLLFSPTLPLSGIRLGLSLLSCRVSLRLIASRLYRCLCAPQIFPHLGELEFFVNRVRQKWSYPRPKMSSESSFRRSGRLADSGFSLVSFASTGASELHLPLKVRWAKKFPSQWTSKSQIGSPRAQSSFSHSPIFERLCNSREGILKLPKAEERDRKGCQFVAGV